MAQGFMRQVWKHEPQLHVQFCAVFLSKGFERASSTLTKNTKKCMVLFCSTDLNA